MEPGSFLLFAGSGYIRTIVPDVSYDGDIQRRGGVMLRAPTGARVDAVGFSPGIACTETAPAPGPLPGQAVLRLGCQDTDVNAFDFVLVAPPFPRNSLFTSGC
jgi:hypothetical protein